MYSDSGGPSHSQDDVACRRIEAAVRDVPPAETRITAFEVEQAVEERLSLTLQEQPQGEPGQLPEGASLETLPVAPGVRSSTLTNHSTGRSIAEVVRPAIEHGRAAEAGQSMIRTTVVPAALPRAALDWQGTFLRWTANSTTRHFGVSPKTETTVEEHSDAAVLLTRPAGVIDLSAVVDAVTVAIATRPRSGWFSAINETLAAADLGTHEAILIRCGNIADSPRTADYCLGPACAKLLDPESFCDGVSKRLER